MNFYGYNANDKAELSGALVRMAELVQSPGIKNVIKVLTTSASQSIHCRLLSQVELKFNMPNNIVKQDRRINVNRQLRSEQQSMEHRSRMFKENSHPDEMSYDDQSYAEEPDMENDAEYVWSYRSLNIPGNADGESLASDDSYWSSPAEEQEKSDGEQKETK